MHLCQQSFSLTSLGKIKSKDLNDSVFDNDIVSDQLYHS
jgi:hypothetical protein